MSVSLFNFGYLLLGTKTSRMVRRLKAAIPPAATNRRKQRRSNRSSPFLSIALTGICLALLTAILFSRQEKKKMKTGLTSSETIEDMGASWAVHMARADSALNSGDWVEAEAAYLEAIAMAPGLSPAYSNLAALLNSRSRFREAIGNASKAVTLATASGELASASVNLGIGLQSISDERAALDAFLVARDADDRSLEARQYATSLALALGDLETAAACARESIVIDPTMAGPSALVLMRLGQDVGQSSSDPNDAATFFTHFERLAGAGHFELAWNAVTAANEAVILSLPTERREAIAVEQQTTSKMVSAVVSSFDSLPAPSASAVMPLLLVGPPRAGSTLLAAALSRHSQITLISTSLLNDALAHYGPSPFMDNNRTILDPLRDAYLAEGHTTYLLDANTDSVWWLGAAVILFEGAVRALILSREASPLAFSCFKTLFLMHHQGRDWTYEPRALLARLDGIHQLSKHWLRSLPHELRFPVQYTGLLADPTRTISTIIVDFLQLQLEPDCFKPNTNPLAFHTPAAIELRTAPTDENGRLLPRQPRDWLPYATELIADATASA